MDILLYGEYSSLHRFLKEGLQQIGNHSIRLISGGDGWKKIPGRDFDPPTRKGNGIYAYAKYLWEWVDFIDRQIHFDVVQFINAGAFPRPIARILINKLRKSNRCLSLLCAGDDYELVLLYRKHFFKHSHYDFEKKSLVRYKKTTVMGRLSIANEKYMANQVDIIIPSLYEYSLGYAGKNMYDIIPFPINLDGLEYQPNIPKGKIVFFHGINRELAKGTPFIRAALNRLAERYPNDVDVIINQRMPYNEYVQVMRRANVIVDQCCGNGYGINACLSMAQGKVTMAGNDPTQRPSINSEFCPIVHVEPDADQIYAQFEFLLENRRNFEQWGYESRKYVETYHECKMIAQKYVDAWKSTGKV